MLNHPFKTFWERFGKIENFRIFGGREGPPDVPLKNFSKPQIPKFEKCQNGHNESQNAPKGVILHREFIKHANSI